MAGHFRMLPRSPTVTESNKRVLVVGVDERDEFFFLAAEVVVLARLRNVAAHPCSALAEEKERYIVDDEARLCVGERERVGLTGRRFSNGFFVRRRLERALLDRRQSRTSAQVFAHRNRQGSDLGCGPTPHQTQSGKSDKARREKLVH